VAGYGFAKGNAGSGPECVVPHQALAPAGGDRMAGFSGSVGDLSGFLASNLMKTQDLLPSRVRS